MTFSDLHRALGLDPGDFTDDMIEAAVGARVAETTNLDWKAEVPPARNLAMTDFPKDVAAMANCGGGLLVHGVTEKDGYADARVDVGAVDETHVRSLIQCAVSAIYPPVFGVKVHRLGAGEFRALIVEVPGSPEAPHLIYRKDYFGAPLRNGPQTIWMRESQIERMYRDRFEERRRAADHLDYLYGEAKAGLDLADRAWFVGVAHPRLPRTRVLTVEDARLAFNKASKTALHYINSRWPHPLEYIDRLNPRPGLRRWRGMCVTPPHDATWRQAWATLHNDGSVTLAGALGGRPVSAHQKLHGWQVEADALEVGVADFMSLLRAAAGATDNDEYDIRIGLEWDGPQQFEIVSDTRTGFPGDQQYLQLPAFKPVESSINAMDSDADFHSTMHSFALDCLNQAGQSSLRLIKLPEPESETHSAMPSKSQDMD